MSKREELIARMQECSIVDCHSHTKSPETYYKEGPFSIFNLNSYWERDIVGLADMQALNACTTDEQRWEIFKGALEKGRNISYWRHNIVTFQKYFGLRDNELTDENWKAVNDAIRTKTADPDWYDYTSRRAVKVETQIRNIPWFDDWLSADLVSSSDEQIYQAKWMESWDKRYFTGTLRMEYMIFLYRLPLVEKLGDYTATPIRDLKSLKLALSRLVDIYVERGIVGLKTTHAYFRTLQCEKVDEVTASALFDKILKGEKLTENEIRQFQDHMIWYMPQLCREKKLLFQVHTGLQHCFADLRDCNPLHLVPMIGEYRDVAFDLFHAGMPYIHEFNILCKLFLNTYANFAWTYVISPAMTRTALSECIDLVPGSRILAFGSDVKYPELIGSHLDMCFSCVADVLEEKISRDYLSEAEAFALIDKMFTKNGRELYRL